MENLAWWGQGMPCPYRQMEWIKNDHLHQFHQRPTTIPLMKILFQSAKSVDSLSNLDQAAGAPYKRICFISTDSAYSVSHSVR